MVAVVSRQRSAGLFLHTAGAGVALAVAAGGRHVVAETVSFTPAADSTMYSEAVRSNGAGAHFFAGRTDSGKLRRGLIAFDVAATVPAGSTITAVTLDLYMSRTDTGMVTVNLHRVLSDWGEGMSDAPGEEGGVHRRATAMPPGSTDSSTRSIRPDPRRGTRPAVSTTRW